MNGKKREGKRDEKKNVNNTQTKKTKTLCCTYKYLCVCILL